MKHGRQLIGSIAGLLTNASTLVLPQYGYANAPRCSLQYVATATSLYACTSPLLYAEIRTLVNSNRPRGRKKAISNTTEAMEAQAATDITID